MRVLPETMRVALAAPNADATTHFCYCWQITRRDGVRLGLCDHDEDINFDGIDFFADSSINITALEQRVGLAPHGPEINGALASKHLRDEDLRAGIYDDAEFILWLTDWRDPQNRLQLLQGSFGAVRRFDNQFSVSLRGVGQKLNQQQGRIYQAACSADLGDKHCRFAVARAPFQWQGQVRAVRDNLIVLPPISQKQSWFNGGHIIAGADSRLVVREDKIGANDERHIILWENVPPHIKLGETIILQTGCDKQYETCLRKFNNVINFQGFPTLAEESLLLRVGR